jgi:hypothetical protein|eukprot:COSAG06_NODE_2234_length_7279_cov_4.104457_3_plen_224_part_00
MSTWIALIEAKKDMQNKMAKVIKRIANMKVAAAMSSWIGMVTEAKGMRNKMTKVIKRIANMKVAAAMTKWVALIAELKDMRFKMNKVIKRIANMKMASAFSSWASMVRAIKLKRSQEETERIKELFKAELAKVQAAAGDELESLKALLKEKDEALAAYAAEHAAFESRVDSLMQIPDFAMGAERLRRPGSRTPSPRSGASPGTGRQGERSVLKARAALKSPSR